MQRLDGLLEVSGEHSQSVTFRFQKLLGFETFPIFWIVSDSVSKKFGIEKSIEFGIGKKLVSKKVSDSVSEKFGIEKSIGFGDSLTLMTMMTRTTIKVI